MALGDSSPPGEGGGPHPALSHTPIICWVLKASVCVAPATSRCKDIESKYHGGDQRAHVALEAWGELSDPPSRFGLIMGLSGQSFNWTELLAGSEVAWATGLHRTPFQVSGRARLVEEGWVAH